MRRPTLRSAIEGGAVVVIGSSVLILIPSQVTVIPGYQSGMSPGFIPGLVAVGLIIVGLALVLKSVFRPADSEPTETARIDWDTQSGLRIIVTILLLIAYISLFPVVGFVVTSAVFVGFFTWFFGARSWVRISLLVALTPIAVWLFFEKLFRIPLPHGFLF